MGKFANDSVLDDGLDLIKNNCNLQIACSAQPTTRTEAVTTYALADVAMTSSDFTVQDNGSSGRELVIAAKTAVPVDTTSTITHLALVSASELLFVTTTGSLPVADTETIAIPEWKIRVNDPT